MALEPADLLVCVCPQNTSKRKSASHLCQLRSKVEIEGIYVTDRLLTQSALKPADGFTTGQPALKPAGPIEH